jgi:hypothetical protein
MSFLLNVSKGYPKLSSLEWNDLHRHCQSSHQRMGVIVIGNLFNRLSDLECGEGTVPETGSTVD